MVAGLHWPRAADLCWPRMVADLRWQRTAAGLGEPWMAGWLSPQMTDLRKQRTAACLMEPRTESGPCPRGPEPSSGLSVETETQVRGMNAEPPDGGSDLGMIRRRRSGHLCIAGVDPMPPLVLPLSSYLSGERCAIALLAGHKSVCFPSGPVHHSSIVQGEDIRSPPSPGSPVLAFPDVVLRVFLPSGG